MLLLESCETGFFPPRWPGNRQHKTKVKIMAKNGILFMFWLISTIHFILKMEKRFEYSQFVRGGTLIALIYRFKQKLLHTSKQETVYNRGMIALVQLCLSHHVEFYCNWNISFNNFNLNLVTGVKSIPIVVWQLFKWFESFRQIIFEFICVI